MTARGRSSLAVLVLAAGAACAGRAPAPRDVEASDTCAFCRMVVSNPRVAAQIVAPGEESRFFDDIGCAVNALKQVGLPAGAVIYVADFRTGKWIVAREAVYARVESLETPMGSHLVAFANEESRGQDKRAAGAVAMKAADVFGVEGLQDE
jgi:copper chaperone NosL